MASVGRNIYELDPAGGELPSPNYTNPASHWVATGIAESPNGILVSGDANGQNVSILELTLDSSGGVPTLSGGSTVASLPTGETIKSMVTYVGSYLIVGTSKGVRIGSFDQYGTLNIGPLTVSTDKPVYAVGGRDRFAYCSYSDQQEDGTTGIARVDLSFVTDSAGRLAWAPDLRPAAGEATNAGDVYSIGLLANKGRLYFVTKNGIYVENGSAAASGDAWLRTSRIRYDTTTPKLWTKGKIVGDPESGFSVKVTRSSGATDSHPDVDDTTGEFGFDTTLDTWVQVQVNLSPGAVLNSYEVSAIPAPKRQHMILCSANCYQSELDRWKNTRIDPDSPRTRWANVVAMEETGNQLVFTEYGTDAIYTDNVVIDQLQFQQITPPQKANDFGGIITFKLRIVD